MAWIARVLAGLLLVAGSASAQEAETQALADSLRAEHDALIGLVDVLKVEVREQRLHISDPAKLSWQRTLGRWAELRAQVEGGAVPEVLAAAGPARALVEVGATEAFSVRASTPIKRAVKRCVDAIGPRVETVRKAVEVAHVEALDQRWRHLKDTFDGAKRLAAVDDYSNAWPTLVSAADQADRLALEVIFAVPPVSVTAENR